jgi:hypothetical protein
MRTPLDSAKLVIRDLALQNDERPAALQHTAAYWSSAIAMSIDCALPANEVLMRQQRCLQREWSRVGRCPRAMCDRGELRQCAMAHRVSDRTLSTFLHS